MVVAWEIRDKDGGLITTFFNERKASKARDKLEAKGQMVRMTKVFDHHEKDREPVVRQKRQPYHERNGVREHIPEGCRPVMIFVRRGDIITSELGIGINQLGQINDGGLRMVVTDKWRVVPVVSKEDRK